MVTLPETKTGEEKKKKITICEYKMELGKPYCQIFFLYANPDKSIFLLLRMVILMITPWMIFSMILVWIT